MLAKNANKINKELGKLTYNTYFVEIPLRQIFDILAKCDQIPLDIDGTPWSGILCGHNGQMRPELSGSG